MSHATTASAPRRNACASRWPGSAAHRWTRCSSTWRGTWASRCGSMPFPARSSTHGGCRWWWSSTTAKSAWCGRPMATASWACCSAATTGSKPRCPPRSCSGAQGAPPSCDPTPRFPTRAWTATSSPTVPTGSGPSRCATGAATATSCWPRFSPTCWHWPRRSSRCRSTTAWCPLSRNHRSGYCSAASCSPWPSSSCCACRARTSPT